MTTIYFAGWSSPVAREAHNLEVVGSNPAPATTMIGYETNRQWVNTKSRRLATSQNVGFFRISLAFSHSYQLSEKSRAAGISR